MSQWNAIRRIKLYRTFLEKSLLFIFGSHLDELGFFCFILEIGLQASELTVWVACWALLYHPLILNTIYNKLGSFVGC